MTGGADDDGAEGRARLSPIVLVVNDRGGSVAAALRQSGLLVTCDLHIGIGNQPPDVFRNAPEIRDDCILAEFGSPRSYDPLIASRKLRRSGRR